jgi:steroid 5-alpha reductase family enzyme|tara:strand:+ start:4993 stop:5808 length:816 start_codon:yes stop_codon:yes gene_type:complete
MISFISSPGDQTLSDQYLITGFLAVISFMTILWLVSLIVKDASIVDIFWGPAFIVLSSSLLVAMNQVYSERSLFILFLVSVWAIRLASHIGFRNIGHGEDFRYIEWREEGGKNYWWFSFFRVFLLQGTLCTLVGLSIYFGYLNNTPLSFIESMMCSSIFFIGLAWESISDLQLKAFRKNPNNKGKICKTGLWKYSRHPNYFGDLLVWISIFTFSVSSQNIYLITGSFLSPLIMGAIFYYITGPIMDHAMIQSRPDYKKYMENSNSLLPKFK